VALAERSAAKVPIQRRAPSLPLAQNVNSVALAEPAASHFGGSIAKSANIANRVQ